MDGWKDRLENTGENLFWLKRNCYQQTLFIWWPKPYDEISCSKLGLVHAVKASQIAQTAMYSSVPHERRQWWSQAITTQIMCRALSFQVVRAETLNLTPSTQFFFFLVHYIGHRYKFQQRTCTTWQVWKTFWDLRCEAKWDLPSKTSRGQWRGPHDPL